MTEGMNDRVSYTVAAKKKERKKENRHAREGWEDGTPPPHTGILRRGVWCASRRPPLGVRLFLYLSSQSLADSRCNLHATSRSSHSRRSLSCRFFLCRFALLCLVLRRRRCLPIPCPRLSAQLCPPRSISWPLEFIELSSRKDDSSDTHCDHLPASHIVAQVFSSDTCTSTARLDAVRSLKRAGFSFQNRHGSTLCRRLLADSCPERLAVGRRGPPCPPPAC